jgi:hypothetical protein
MSDIAQGNFAKIVLKPGDSYRVTTSGVATVESRYGAPAGTTTVTANSVTFGPYNVEASLKVTAVTGSCDVNQNIGVNIERSASGAITDPASLDAVRGAVGTEGLVNWKASNTRQIAAAYLGAQAGDLSSRVIVAQDSFGAGTASTNNGTVNARSKSWPRLFAALAQARGLAAYDTWACGNGVNGGNIATYEAYDPRVDIGSATTLNSTWNGVAGNSWSLGADTTNGFVELTPQIAFDTLDILYARAPATGVFRLLDQAATQAGGNINTVNGTNGVAEATVTFPTGSTKAKAIYASTAFSLIGGMGVRNSSANGIEVINTSISGVETSFFAATDGNSWAAHRPSLAVLFGSRTAGRNVYALGGGYNDINIGGASIDTVKTRMRSRITHLRSLTNAPDIIVLGYCKVGTTSESAQLALNEALRSVAVDEYDLPFVDLYSITEDAASAITKGFMASDQLHMRASYQGLLAKTVLGGFDLAARLGV